MQPIHIDLVEVYDRVSGAMKVFHLCDLADANCPFEWWISADGKHHALFHQDAFYDGVLSQRRSSGNMICPQDKAQRLFLAGPISRQIELDSASYVEVFRSRFRLDSVSVDGK
jgi:hypothetical protein